MRFCYRCRELKAESEFGPTVRNKAGLTSWCKSCSATYNRQRSRGMKAGTWDPGKRKRQCSVLTPLPGSDPGPIDIAWAAGFIEGEGAFVPMHGRGIRVKVVQVNQEPLKYLQNMFGGSIYKQKRYGPRQQSFAWTVNGWMAEQVIRVIYDLLSTRRKQQAQVLLRMRE